MSAWEFYGILDSFNLRTLKPMAFDPQSDQFSQVCFWFAGADNSVDPLQPPHKMLVTLVQDPTFNYSTRWKFDIAIGITMFQWVNYL